MGNLNKIRVLCASDHLGHADGKIHGGTTYFIEHLPKLAQAVELATCFLGKYHPAVADLEKQSIAPIFLNHSKWNPKSFYDLLKLIRSFKPDILHLHSEKSLAIGRMLGLITKTPTIAHIHDANPLKAPVKQLNRYFAKRTSAAIVVSDEIIEHANKEHGFPKSIISVIHNGLDISRFSLLSANSRSTIRKEFAIPNNEPIIALIGRVNKDKGQLEMIQAMNLITKSFHSCKLLIVGDGPDLMNCKKVVENLGLSKAVIFTGQRNDIPNVLMAATIAAVPSMGQEAFGFTALEAIASGKPVVAFRSGGIPNMIIHGKTGVLVEKGDIKELARETVALLNNPSKSKAYGKAGKDHAKNFSVEKHIEKLLEVYRTVLLKDRN